jgi:hypothetical protein
MHIKANELIGHDFQILYNQIQQNLIVMIKVTGICTVCAKNILTN